MLVPWEFSGSIIQQKNLPANIVYLTINDEFHGVGAGLIIDHQLYEGGSGIADEIATCLPLIPKLMERGKKKYNSNSLILNRKSNAPISLADVIEYSKRNCRVSSFILTNLCQVITKDILLIISLINPDLIVVGGDVAEAEFLVNDFTLPNVQKKTSKLFPTGLTIPKIICSRFGIQSVSVGATALVLR